KLMISKLDAMRMQLNQVNTITDLREKTDLLSASQLICLKHFDDLCKTISREEIDKIAMQLKEVVETVNQYIRVTICGSYRRGASENDRIDILLVHSKIKSTKSDAFRLLKDIL